LQIYFSFVLESAALRKPEGLRPFVEVTRLSSNCSARGDWGVNLMYLTAGWCAPAWRFLGPDCWNSFFRRGIFI